MKGDDLIVKHLHLAKATARRMRVPGHLMEEAIGEATVALILAARKFDPQRGAKFPTYAISCMRGACLNVMRDARRTESEAKNLHLASVAHGNEPTDEPETIARAHSALVGMDPATRKLLADRFLHEKTLTEVDERYTKTWNSRRVDAAIKKARRS